ncbi:MAG: RDD family protein [Verrucomicrobiales bacterium]|nr:RDD family protein [Verrucomicrobiales bacterium]
MPGRNVSLRIRTPEGVAFQLPLAGPVSRGLALIVDLITILLLLIVISIALSIVSAFYSGFPVIGDFVSDLSSGLMILFGFVIGMLYGAFLEWIWKGRTVGKRLLGLRVVDERGLSLTAGQIVIRNLFRLLDMLPSAFYMIGGISCALTKRCQRIGDIAAGTVVIREVKVNQPEIDEILEQIENSFATHPHLEARLRQNCTPEDARIALDAVLRRNDFGDRERLRVFGAIADHFREKVEFPEEITLGLSDEQYVRNVVDTLYRRHRTLSGPKSYPVQSAT